MEDDQVEKPASWRELIYEFTQDTTLHGIRFTTRATPYFIRRVLWTLAFCASLAVFIWFCITQLVYLIGRPGTVDVKVLFRKAVDFPTVTICNQNLFKRSLAHRYGQHDTIVEGFSSLNAPSNDTSDTNEKEETVNDFETQMMHKLNTFGPSFNTYKSLTVEVCKLTCIKVVSDSCCSVVYDRRTQTCVITALEPSMPDVDVEPNEDWDYYRRLSCNIKREASCDFEKEATPICNFQVDRSIQQTLQWKRVAAFGLQAVRPDFDHTTMKRTGNYLYASKNRQNAKALFLSPYFSSNNTCVEFYHQIRSGRLTVMQGLRQNVVPIWTRGATISTEWERGYVQLPDGYIRVTLEAAAEKGRVNIAVDDIKISTCQTLMECKTTGLGLGYQGTQTQTRRNKTCERWDTVPEYRRPNNMWNFESLNISAEMNYCRNPDNDPLGLWCITNNETMEMDYCDVPNCKCNATLQFSCKNTRCIALELACNKQDDCGDLSDELDCDEQQVSVNCTFDVWNCTYISPPDSRRQWYLRETNTGGYMTIEVASGRQGDVAIVKSPKFKLTQTGCLEMRYNLSMADKLDLFYLEGENSVFRQHICTLPGIDHPMYQAGLDTEAPPGYNFSVDIPATATNLILIGNSDNDTISSTIIYLFNLVENNCMDFYYPPTDAPTTTAIMTLNFTGSNTTDLLWSNFTTPQLNKTTTDSFFTTTTTTVGTTTTSDFFTTSTSQTGTTNNETTLAPEVTTIEFIAVYYPECEANLTDGCDSCLRNPFFWERGLNDSYVEPVQLTTCDDVWPDCGRWVDFCPTPTQGAIEEGTLDDSVQRNCAGTCEMCASGRGCIEPVGMECSFADNCLCGYMFTSSNRNWVWKREPLSNFTTDEEDAVDKSESDDYYIRVHNLTSVSVPGDWIRLFSPIENFTEARCLNFMYFSRYMDVNVFLYNETDSELLLAITYDGQKRTWHPASTNVPPGRFGVVFELTFSQFALKNAGIDNVTLSSGLCESNSKNPDVNCTFEDIDWCGYMDVSAGPRNWQRTLGATSGSTPRKYFLRTRNLVRGKVARLLQSPIFNIQKQHCLRFDFFDSAGVGGDLSEIRTITVNLLTYADNDDKEPVSRVVIWRVFGTMRDDEWHYAHTNVTAGRHRLLFEVNGDNYQAAIKDVLVLPGHCPDFNCSEAESLGVKKEFFPCEGRFFLCLGKDAYEDEIANCDGGEDQKIKPKDDTDTGPAPTANPDTDDSGEMNIYLENPIANLSELYYKVGHQGEDFIYNCEWDGTECTFGDFTKNITDYGTCYVFNNNIKLDTNKTGARFGLRLTLNIEQYEYMIGPNTDAGVKVFLHAHDEEPQVRDLGFAIAPGLHALVGIQRNDAENLEFPWGECKEGVKLDFFDTYTRSACDVECETKSLVRNCKCRDAYMPGYDENNPPVCDIKQFFECAVPFAAKASSDPNAGNYTYALGKTLPPCVECSLPCTQTVYEPSLSYAQLSTFSVNQILDREDFDIRTKYFEALETVHRVTPITFTTDLRMLSRLQRAYDEMERQVKDFLTGRDEEAMAIKLLNTVAEMTNITEQDCNQLLSEMRLFKKKFDERFGANIDLLVLYHNNLQKDYEQVRQLLMLSIQKTEVSQYLQQTAEQARKWTDLVWDTIDLLRNSMVDDHNEEADQNELLPSEYFSPSTRRACQNAFGMATEDLSALTQLYSNIADQAGRRNLRPFTQNLERLEGSMKQYNLYYKKLQECVSEYSDIVTGIVDWLDLLPELRVQNQQDLKTLQDANKGFDDNRKELKSDAELVGETFKQYSENKTTKEMYLKTITEPAEGGTGTTLASRIGLFTNRIQANMVSPLGDLIKNARTNVERLYREALNHAVDMDPYMAKDFFYVRAASMKIWKLPGPNLENPTVPFFFRETLEMWKIWDQNMNIYDFVRCPILEGECNRNVDDSPAMTNIIAALEQSANALKNEPPGYFKSLESEIQLFETDITTAEQSITSEINDIMVEKEGFQEEQKIESKFIEENFMKIDVYFKQLKYQKVEQKKAYEVLDFLSDVGGYLGLLLGASFLTICEMIDLFLYNGAKKAVASSQASNFGPEAASAETEANGKAVGPPDNGVGYSITNEPPDGHTNLASTDDRGFTSSQFNNKI